ncbi:MAG TPA: magnesium-translocating P-type ATPase, partial [Acidimicrobiia bacterium]|nr:magnesium-translocating P-type ATPase [Acidimicrobiia bacterium]
MNVTREEAASLDADEVLARLGSSRDGLSDDEAARRLARYGPNAIRSHGARPLRVLGRQLDNPLLVLLAAAAILSLATGQHADALIVLAIVTLSVGLGFVNEYRSERAVEDLHERIRHFAIVLRGGRPRRLDVVDLVPGDVVLLRTGDAVPADVRVVHSDGMECDEAVLTGESTPAAKTADAQAACGSMLDLPGVAFMGTLVRAGAGRGVVVDTGPHTVFGRVAVELGQTVAETGFQRGLRDFSVLLVRITTAIAATIFVIDLAVGRTLFDSLMFVLAIAVGLTPELLPAIVTVSLAMGARRLVRRSVVVKRLVTIEDLGNVEVLFTDKTGTLTEGRATLVAAIDPVGQPAPDLVPLARCCSEVVLDGGKVVGGTDLDRALWTTQHVAAADAPRRLAIVPFDFDRRLVSVLAEAAGRRVMITKGAPESVFARCGDVAPAARARLDAELASGHRVIALATRDGAGCTTVTADDERDLVLRGFLVFRDPVKRTARPALDKLARLGIGVKVITGDNDRVAATVCADLGLAVAGTLVGADVERMTDDELAAAIPRTTIFARIAPEQKSRIIRLQRRLGTEVAFLGDGANDAIALHDADVGISVDSAADVAKDAADIVLLRKDLGVLADGVIEGRRIFTNTIKYVLMGTSSNFGNMLSAAGASLFLPFLPMLPTQILLNNLLYDLSELAIPTDQVDAELLERPARWDNGLIRRFMAVFGPISSLYDFVTFGVMLGV